MGSASIVALIPARAGSQRIPGKNMHPLGGHPLLAYTMAAAKQSGVFREIVMSSDDAGALKLACETPGVRFSFRLPAHATNEAPDILWVQWVMGMYRADDRPDAFAILRPTSPFRSAQTIQRAWAQFKDTRGALDSIRAVEPWRSQHPGKLWIYSNAEVRLYPVMKDWTAHAPYHSSPTQSLIPIVRQTASLEMAWREVLEREPPSISGDEIAPFWTEGAEAFDINEPEDLDHAAYMVRTGQWTLPQL